MSTSAPKPFPRSPAGLLGSIELSDESLSRSSSALSSQSASPMARPGVLRRESTQSGGLDNYYWSAHAGIANSSSSSLSAAGLSPSPGFHSALPASGSSSNGLSENHLLTKEMSAPNLLAPSTSSSDHLSPHRFQAGPSRIITSSENGGQVEEMYLESPGGWSGESDYSNEGSGSDSAQIPHSHSRFNGLRADSFGSDDNQSGHSPIDYQALFGPTHPPPANLGDARDSITSTTSEATYQVHQAEEEDPLDKTPVAPPFVDKHDRAGISAPAPLNFDRSPRRDYPRPDPSGRGTSPAKQTTPTRPIASPSARGYTPTSGRIPFTAPLDVHKKSLEKQEVRVDITVPSPKSAPAWKSEFGDILPDFPTEDSETIRSRSKRTTLPASGGTSSGAIVESLLSPEKERDMLSPDKYMRAGSISPEKRTREPSPGRSPELPPRSTLRALGSVTTTPMNLSPQPSLKDLPTIINTPYSPDKKTPEKRQEPPRPTRSPSRTPSMMTEETIEHLTAMLGGAIDAIGIDNKGSTSNIPSPQKDKPELEAGSSTPARDMSDSGPITPTSLPNRGASLCDSAAMPPPPLPRPADQVRRIPSGLSLRNTHQAPAPVVESPTTIAAFSPRPWPAAMLYGNIKSMKYAGDRAKAYAKSVNDLARAETGIREWCAVSASASSRPSPKSAKKASMASIGLRPGQSITSTLIVPPQNHMRNVSSSSEFPMRADSYTAREIPQRAVDPTDAPSSLPPNLPYPQLQAQYASGISGGGMKPSQSMQSISSFSSKRSFFGGIGKKSSSKKDSTALGPPSSSVNKKDVRGLPISSPSYSTSPQRSSDGAGPGETVISRSSAASGSTPMGPRPPRMGSFTPPPTGPNHSLVDIPARSSLDTGLSRISNVPTPASSRGSLDGLRPISGSITRKGSLPPPRQSSLIEGSPTGSGPSDAEVRSMSDILPHVNRTVVKAYLAKYGDQMQAIGMYLEDEKRGKVMRV